MNADVSDEEAMLWCAVPPRVQGQREEDVGVVEGHMVSLLCDVQAYPPPEMTWTRDGQLLQFSSGIHILPGQSPHSNTHRQTTPNPDHKHTHTLTMAHTHPDPPYLDLAWCPVW